MTKPKRHHYVHESYLDRFVLDQQPLRVLDKWENARIFPGTPKNILVEGQYFAQPLHDEKRMDAKLETYFSSVESKWPFLVSQIEACQTLSEESYGFFIECLMMLRTRVPNTRKALEACLRYSVRQTADKLIDHPPAEIAEAFKKHLNRKSLCSEPIEPTLANLIDFGFIKVGIDPHRSLVLLPQMAQKLVPLLGSMKCRSFLHNKTDQNFITNDNPVLFYERTADAQHPQPYPQEDADHFCLIFPITPRIAFYYDSKEVIRAQHRPVRSTKTVQKINSLIALFADRFIVGSTQNSIDVFNGIDNICPVPDFEKSEVLPDRVLQMTYKYGEPIKMDGWKYDFEK